MTPLCVQILEMIWSFGGDLKIRPDYKIDGNLQTTKMYVFRALYLLRYMFREQIVLTDSTMDIGLSNTANFMAKREEDFLRAPLVFHDSQPADSKSSND